MASRCHALRVGARGPLLARPGTLVGEEAWVFAMNQAGMPRAPSPQRMRALLLSLAAVLVACGSDVTSITGSSTSTTSSTTTSNAGGMTGSTTASQGGATTASGGSGGQNCHGDE